MTKRPDPRHAFTFAGPIPEDLLRHAGWLSPAEAQALRLQVEYLTVRCERLEAELEDETPLAPAEAQTRVPLTPDRGKAARARR